MSFSTSLIGLVRGPSTFGQYIKRARLEKGLTQKEVACALGLNEMTIVNWERYETVPRRLQEKFDSLCGLLSIDGSQLQQTFPHRRSLWQG